MIRNSGLLLVLLLIASPAAAQIKEDRPRFILNTGGPAGVTPTMAFSADSGSLYAGGLDKITHVWNVNAPGRPRLVRSLRWEAARSFLGSVYAVAASPVKKDGRVAIGGASARNGRGDIVIYNAATGQVERALPANRTRETMNTGHLSAVVCLSWSPDGKKLLSASDDGEVRVWSAPNWSSTVLRAKLPANAKPADATRARQMPVLFLDDRNAVVAESLGNDWRLAVFDTENNNRRLGLNAVHRKRVTALARMPGGARWASTDAGGSVFIWRGSGAQNPQRLPRKRTHSATALSFSTDGKLAVANERTATDAWLQLWDANANRLIDEVAVSTREDVLCCALAADGSRLATQQVDTNEVLVFNLAGAAKPLSGARPRRLRGTGKSVYHVAFAANGDYTLGFGTTPNPANPLPFNQYGEVERAFDVSRPRYIQNPAADGWRSPDDAADGWRVRDGNGGQLTQAGNFNVGNQTAITLVKGGVIRGRINLDPRYQGALRCYCWIPDENDKPRAVALGTNGQNGVFVYSMPNGGRCTLLRYFRDHNDTVFSLTCSKDGKYLASSADDQLIKVWSLEGLQPRNGFSKRGGWGTDLTPNDNGLKVVNVLAGGIAIRRGLQDGDVITKLQYPRGNRYVTVTDGRGILNAIEQTPLFRTLLLTTNRDVKEQPPILMTPAWEPVLTLFTDIRREWALWTPEGYYDSSVAAGNELFGWQINRGPALTPRILKAAELEKEFERPDVIRKLLSAGHIPGAFRALNQPVPGNLNTQVADVARQVPRVRIVEPRTNQTFARGADVTVKAEIQFPLARKAEDFRVRAIANGIPLGKPAIAADGTTYTWTTKPPDAFCKFEVIVEEADAGIGGLMKSDAVAVRSDVAPRTYRVHILAVAANNYQGGLQELKFAKKDAQAVLDLVRAKQGPFYTLGDVHVLLNEDVTRARVENKISEVKDSLAGAGPEDVLVLYLAGHGYAFGQEYFYIPPDVPDLSRDTLETGGVSWLKLKELEDVPCRKVVLLDTCRSGNVLLAKLNELDEPLPSQIKASIRPLKRSGFLVVTATGIDENALEGSKFGGHGAFTKALMDGLEGAADGVIPPGLPLPPKSDGIVELLEMAAFVKEQVLKSTNGIQEPSFTPEELFELSELPLVRANNAGR